MKALFTGLAFYQIPRKSQEESAEQDSLRLSPLTAGIVQGKGRIAHINKKADFSTLQIHFPDSKLKGAQVGASIAINGTCLTVRLFI